MGSPVSFLPPYFSGIKAAGGGGGGGGGKKSHMTL